MFLSYLENFFLVYTGILIHPRQKRYSLLSLYDVKLGYFDPTKNLLKVVPQPWASSSEQIWIRSFKWGTVHSCKSRGCKNIWGRSWTLQRKLPTWPYLNPMQLGVGWTGRFFINLQLWPLIFLQPLDLQGHTVPHLKDMIHICLEDESQGHGMTFNMIYDRSRYPHFISYRGFC